MSFDEKMSFLHGMWDTIKSAMALFALLMLYGINNALHGIAAAMQ